MCKPQRLTPTVTSYNTVCRMLDDPLLEAKIGFFAGLSGASEEFLTKYQDEKPLFPFLLDLEYLIRCLLDLFVKVDVMKEASTWKKRLEVDMKTMTNQKSPRNITLYFQAKLGVKIAPKKLSDKDLGCPVPNEFLI